MPETGLSIVEKEIYPFNRTRVKLASMTYALITSQWFPLLVILPAVGMILAAAHYLLIAKHKDLGSEARLPRQMLLLVLTFVAIVMVVLSLPVEPATRDQILGLLGIALSAAFALSSTAFVTNLMAAIMLRVTRPFKVGDFIEINGHFGKVSERGLFDTEIQTENRRLIAIPNSTFIHQPVSVARTPGMVISTDISLGYDVHHEFASNLLIVAAETGGLADPYVHVVSLDDHAVGYRLSAILTEGDAILTARSKLNRHVLDTLHNAGVEIVSPSVTRHITQSEGTKIFPRPHHQAASTSSGTAKVTAEEIVFDKANEAFNLEQEKSDVMEELAMLSSAGNTDDNTQREALNEQLKVIKQKLKSLSDS